jgi:hypothetical protein
MYSRQVTHRISDCRDMFLQNKDNRTKVVLWDFLDLELETSIA